MQLRLGVEEGITYCFVFVGATIVRIVRPWLEVALLWYAMHSLFRSAQLFVFLSSPSPSPFRLKPSHPRRSSPSLLGST